ncbi:hypothetical protein JK159_02485 [Weissella minor]|uniref:hypothetical protein n=1 Tax=Weissella minor TaxID=1620 RepID=UPI001BAF06CE|nr:hypothetical protein [Weissella minor]MBS0949251.1 hypothetical protein [Weissella minor]
MYGKKYSYITVDYTKKRILLIAPDEARLNQEILIWYSQHGSHTTAMWKYRVLTNDLMQMQLTMKETGKPFYEIAQPKYIKKRTT